MSGPGYGVCNPNLFFLLDPFASRRRVLIFRVGIMKETLQEQTEEDSAAQLEALEEAAQEANLARSRSK